MRKYLILLYKDLLMMLKDKAGMGYLFVMPVALVLIMVAIQDSSFNSVKKIDIKIAVQNKDRDSVGNLIVRELQKSGFFTVLEVPLDKTPEEVEKEVLFNRAKIALLIPAKTTYRLKRATAKSRDAMLKNTDSLVLGTNDKTDIKLFFSPIINVSNKMLIFSILKEIAAEMDKNTTLRNIERFAPNFNSDLLPRNALTFSELKAIDTKTFVPDSVQHNVPAWTVFAMFFIVMSLAGNMIREREEGSFLRLRYMPFPLVLYTTSKMTIYFLVGIIQLILMILMGIFVLPLLGFSALHVAGKIPELTLIGSFTALAATAYGLLIGTMARTYQQALSFGSISVVILAAIGGVWVPVMIMPPFMQKISIISPLNWSVEAFQKILTVQLSVSSILKELGLLFVFATSLYIIASYMFKRNFTRSKY